MKIVYSLNTIFLAFILHLFLISHLLFHCKLMTKCFSHQMHSFKPWEHHLWCSVSIAVVSILRKGTVVTCHPCPKNSSEYVPLLVLDCCFFVVLVFPVVLNPQECRIQQLNVHANSAIIRGASWQLFPRIPASQRKEIAPWTWQETSWNWSVEQ